ncbi:MAG: hypothetical protein MSC31_04645 [Solirubrobacteraceae bacterium MAG38_C4-C5]|nr:hypothetical protein [Candidatus Siliceabacter maunaloa]
MGSTGSYGRGARVLSVGLALTGVVTLAYFVLATYALDRREYGAVSLLWSITFIVATVIYRPIEQLLARTVARGHEFGRVPALIQGGFALGFLVVALALRGPLVELLNGSQALYWILVAAVLAYAASYFARGYLAGSGRFELYGGLVFVEATSRVLFPLAVVLGVAGGQTAVALGIAAAPVLSLLVVPWALRRRARTAEAAEEARGAEAARGALSLRTGTGFAGSVLVISAAEQTLINAAVLTTQAAAPLLVGVVFNALLIVRAPLQLFQAVQGSLLPHLANAQADEFTRALRVTVLAIAGFAGAVALGLLAVGPLVMGVFDIDYDYGRLGLAALGLGMGFHLVAGTLNQAALARDRGGRAAAAWVVAAVAFVVWLLAPVVDDPVLRVEVGYLGATVGLAAMLGMTLRRGG